MYDDIEITLTEKCNAESILSNSANNKNHKPKSTLDVHMGAPMVSVLATHMHLRVHFGTPGL